MVEDRLGAATDNASNAGIVIIRYEGSSARATGGSISYISGYVIHTFTANGTFSVI
jgi:hypothetical protein